MQKFEYPHDYPAHLVMNLRAWPKNAAKLSDKAWCNRWWKADAVKAPASTFEPRFTFTPSPDGANSVAWCQRLLRDTFDKYGADNSGIHRSACIKGQCTDACMFCGASVATKRKARRAYLLSLNPADAPKHNWETNYGQYKVAADYVEHRAQIKHRWESRKPAVAMFTLDGYEIKAYNEYAVLILRDGRLEKIKPTTSRDAALKNAGLAKYASDAPSASEVMQANIDAFLASNPLPEVIETLQPLPDETDVDCNPVEYVESVTVPAVVEPAIMSESPCVYTVNEGRKPGYIEVTFTAKPADYIRANLKKHGFKWNSKSTCWWGKAERWPLGYSSTKGECDRATSPVMQREGIYTQSDLSRARAAVESRKPVVVPQVPAIAGMSPLGMSESSRHGFEASPELSKMIVAFKAGLK